jgi:hypothetical protein
VTIRNRKDIASIAQTVLEDGVGWRKHFDRQIRRSEPERRGPTRCRQTIAPNEGDIRRADGVRLARQLEPRLGADNNAQILRPDMADKRRGQIGNDRAVIESGWRRCPQFAVHELVALPVVRQPFELVGAHHPPRRAHERHASIFPARISVLVLRLIRLSLSVYGVIRTRFDPRSDSLQFPHPAAKRPAPCPRSAS